VRRIDQAVRHTVAARRRERPIEKDLMNTDSNPARSMTEIFHRAPTPLPCANLMQVKAARQPHIHTSHKHAIVRLAQSQRWPLLLIAVGTNVMMRPRRAR
jgi:hypothetical protein